MKATSGADPSGRWVSYGASLAAGGENHAGPAADVDLDLSHLAWRECSPGPGRGDHQAEVLGPGPDPGTRWPGYSPYQLRTLAIVTSSAGWLTWVQLGPNFAVPFLVSSYGYLTASRVPSRAPGNGAAA